MYSWHVYQSVAEGAMHEENQTVREWEVSRMPAICL